MAFNINDFKSKFEETGVLQTNKYDVTINFENTALQTLSINNNLGGSTSSFSTVQDDLTYRCVAASIPGLTMRTTDVNRYGVGV